MLKFVVGGSSGMLYQRVADIHAAKASIAINIRQNDSLDECDVSIILGSPCSTNDEIFVFSQFLTSAFFVLMKAPSLFISFGIHC